MRRIIFTTLLFLSFASQVSAASRFWVGGTGTWDGASTAHWSATSGGASGVSVPGSADDVTFDTNSTGTITLATTTIINSLAATTFASTFNTNGFGLTSIGAITFTGSGVRTITLGTSTITTSSWNFTSTNLTFSGASSTILINGSATSLVFIGAGLTYGTTTITDTAVLGNTVSMNGANTFFNFTYNAPAGIQKFTLGANQTINGRITINGNSSTTNRAYFLSDTTGTPRTITAANVTASSTDFEDIIGAGAGSWNLSAITGLSGDCGGNSGITFTTATTTYWIGNTGSWSDATKWSALSSGSGSTSHVPLCQDSSIFDNGSFNAGSQTVTQDMPRIGGVNWSAYNEGQNPTWTTSTAASVFGSLILNSGMTLTASTQAYTFEGRGTYTVTMAGKTWDKPITFDTFNGTYTLSDFFTTGATRTLTLLTGTLTAQANVSTGQFTSSQANTRTLNMGSGTWYLTNTGATTVWNLGSSAALTINANTSTIQIVGNTTSVKTFAGLGQTYNKVWMEVPTANSQLTITGANIFNEFRVDYPPQIVVFPAATTNTFTTFAVSGELGKLVTIKSSTNAAYTLAKTGAGVVNSKYLSIASSTATPSTLTWYAGTGSTNVSGNTGWIFANPQPHVSIWAYIKMLSQYFKIQ
jgi:hypothetical protein